MDRAREVGDARPDPFWEPWHDEAYEKLTGLAPTLKLRRENSPLIRRSLALPPHEDDGA